MSLGHFVRFNVASFMGIPVQVATLWTLVHAGALPYLPATALAVAAAVAHNFLWHWHWTWADRSHPSTGAFGAFWRFALANGLVSLIGNLLAMPLLVGWLEVPLVPANLAAVALTGLVNFRLADRLVFRVAPSSLS